MGPSNCRLSAPPTFSTDRTQEAHPLQRMVQDKSAYVVLAHGSRLGPHGQGLPPLSALKDLEMRRIDPRHAANRAAIHFPTNCHKGGDIDLNQEDCVLSRRGRRALMLSRIPPSHLSCHRVAALPMRYSIPGSGEGKLPRVQTSKAFRGAGPSGHRGGLRHAAGDNALRRSLSASICGCQR